MRDKDEVTALHARLTAEIVRDLKTKQRTCGGASRATVRERKRLQKLIEKIKVEFYVYLYGHEPPCDLPENWLEQL